MAEAILDAPLTLDPKQATKLVLRRADVDFAARTVEIDYVLVDATGKTIDRKRITASGPQVQTWINNQETTIYNRLLAVLGVTGTIA